MGTLTRRIKSATSKSKQSIKAEGPLGFAKRTTRYVYYRQFPEKKKKYYRDILFVNGNTLPHPTRYRVDHQIEPLRASGMTADAIFYNRLNPDMLKYYRGFVFFRCPITDTVRDFIEEAKRCNKTCFFDIDDLVIDQKYTDQIEYVKNMLPSDKAHYNDGVNRMRATLQLCDYAITTTERLQQELRNYIDEVFINRNVASDEMVHHSLKALRRVTKPQSEVVIGYFSGSITHNENFALVMPSLLKLFDKYPNLYLKVAGILNIPPELDRFKDRLIRVDFMDWRAMPKEIATCDINIAPLIDTIFNEAKSENKWIEAALVKVVTVASDIGAFKSAIKHGKTGVLVKDAEDWFGELDALIADENKCTAIANAAHEEVINNHVTIYTGTRLAEFIKSKLAKNVAFVLPSTDISGGVNVVLRHAEILRSHGYDPTIISLESRKNKHHRALPGLHVLVAHKVVFEGYFNNMVATLWLTLKWVKKYPNATSRSYFVQNFETNFYQYGNPARMAANSTYNETVPINYLTMSGWCQGWLKERYGKEARYASNGIDLQYYPAHKRTFSRNQRIKILIEGDSRDHYKNVDESFQIVANLDPEKYEVSYLSYRSKPKRWYRVDKFYNKIPPEEVGKIYASCDILIKSSILESFSYPPLEMMATGGFAIVAPNGGNAEYLRDRENCLLYKQGDIAAAAKAIETIASDASLRKKLHTGGLTTARAYEWKHKEQAIVDLYR